MYIHEVNTTVDENQTTEKSSYCNNLSVIIVKTVARLVGVTYRSAVDLIEKDSANIKQLLADTDHTLSYLHSNTIDRIFLFIKENKNDLELD